MNIAKAASSSVLAVIIAMGIGATDAYATCGGGGGGGGGGSRVRRGGGGFTNKPKKKKTPARPESDRQSSSKRLGGSSRSSSKEKSGKVRAEIYNTVWVDHADADEMTTGRSYGHLHYFLPERDSETHDAFHTKILADLSKKYPAIKYDYDASEAWRTRWKVDGTLHVVVIADKYGNEYKRFEGRSSADDAISYRKIKSALSGAGGWSKGQRKDLQKRVDLAKRLLAADDLVRCLTTLRIVRESRGHDAVEQANTMWGEAIEKARARIDECRGLQDKGEARKTLEWLLPGLEGTELEADCQSALEGLR